MDLILEIAIMSFIFLKILAAGRRENIDLFWLLYINEYDIIVSQTCVLHTVFNFYEVTHGHAFIVHSKTYLLSLTI